MKIIGHPKLNIFQSMKLEILEFDWKTKNNNVDCDVFLMRHMEVYHAGEEAKIDCVGSIMYCVECVLV